MRPVAYSGHIWRMMEDIMAIRYRKGRASPWQCYWNNPLTGKRECANFGTQHEAEKHDSLIKHRIKFDRESFRREKEEPEEKTEALTLEGAYLLYLKQKQFNKTGLNWQLTSMRYPLQMLGGIPVQDITREVLDGLAQGMLAMPVKRITVRDRLRVLRTVLRWCAESGFRGPVDFPQLPSARYEHFVPPTPDEIRSILVHGAPHIVRIVIIGAQLGVRVGPSELLRLTWNDVDIERRVLRVHGACKNLNAPWREVPIKEALVPVFKAWKLEDAVSGDIYLVHHRGKRVVNFHRAWYRALQRAGITRRIRPYDLRHAFGTEMVAAGVDVGTVANLMGHNNPNMLLTHYQHVLDKQKVAAVEALPDLGLCVQGYVPKLDNPQNNQ